MTKPLPNGRYWLDCGIEDIECVVLDGEVYTDRATDGKIIHIETVSGSVPKRLTPRNGFVEGLDDTPEAGF